MTILSIFRLLLNPFCSKNSLQISFYCLLKKYRFATFQCYAERSRCVHQLCQHICLQTTAVTMHFGPNSCTIQTHLNFTFFIAQMKTLPASIVSQVFDNGKLPYHACQSELHAHDPNQPFRRINCNHEIEWIGTFPCYSWHEKVVQQSHANCDGWYHHKAGLSKPAKGW